MWKRRKSLRFPEFTYSFNDVTYLDWWLNLPSDISLLSICHPSFLPHLHLSHAMITQIIVISTSQICLTSPAFLSSLISHTFCFWTFPSNQSNPAHITSRSLPCLKPSHRCKGKMPHSFMSPIWTQFLLLPSPAFDILLSKTDQPVCRWARLTGKQDSGHAHITTGLCYVGKSGGKTDCRFQGNPAWIPDALFGGEWGETQFFHKAQQHIELLTSQYHGTSKYYSSPPVP